MNFIGDAQNPILGMFLENFPDFLLHPVWKHTLVVITLKVGGTVDAKKQTTIMFFGIAQLYTFGKMYLGEYRLFSTHKYHLILKLSI